jgi:tetraacyldisaccharide 4'-kinase
MRKYLHDWLSNAWGSPPGRPPRGAWVLDASEGIYRRALRLRRVRPSRAALPVVSVGSLLVGGAGKTPLAALLARLAREEGLRPAILLRGYGGNTRGGMRRVPEAIGAEEVARFGDEACLHARFGDAAVYVNANRIAAAEEAARNNCGLAILDDGMQHQAIERNWEIVSLPGDCPVGNGRLLPRGPLREPEGGLDRADLIVLSHATTTIPPPETLVLLRRLAPRAPILSWKAGISLRALSGSLPSPGSSVAILCGIGRPGALRYSIGRLGHPVAWVAAFPDHHRFRQGEIDSVRRRAERDGIGWIITTAKDEMRLLGLETGATPGFCCADLRPVWNEPNADSRLRYSLQTIAGAH